MAKYKTGIYPLCLSRRDAIAVHVVAAPLPLQFPTAAHQVQSLAPFKAIKGSQTMLWQFHLSLTKTAAVVIVSRGEPGDNTTSVHEKPTCIPVTYCNI